MKDTNKNKNITVKEVLNIYANAKWDVIEGNDELDNWLYEKAGKAARRLTKSDGFAVIEIENKLAAIDYSLIEDEYDREEIVEKIAADCGGLVAQEITPLKYNEYFDDYSVIVFF